ncbi:hypothetical protein [Amycolatopsis rhizosphaerae]|nr:hypothetical protein [Amycolatopsis rhizosphaerae]
MTKPASKSTTTTGVPTDFEGINLMLRRDNTSKAPEATSHGNR